MKQSLWLGRTVTPGLITPTAMSRCRPNSLFAIGTSRFRFLKPIKLSYHSQYKLKVVTNDFILKPCISHQWLLLNSVQVKHFLDSVKPCCRTSSALVLLVKAVLSSCVHRFWGCYPNATAALGGATPTSIRISLVRCQPDVETIHVDSLYAIHHVSVWRAWLHSPR